MSKKGKIFFETLDGLRFLSFLVVFLYHSFYTENTDVLSNELYLFLTDRLFSNGNLGVNFFFVLSGFLITYLLIEEKLKTGRIDVLNFWMRRVLRIWPLFYLAMLFGFFGFPLLKTFFGQIPSESANIGYYLTFLNNFDLIKNGLPDASILGVLWSVAIEEQFYLLWPLILFKIPIKKYWIPFCVVILSSILYRACTNVDLTNEFHTLSCIGDMAVGAFSAWLIKKKNVLSLFEQAKKYQLVLVYIFFGFIFLFRKELFFDVYFFRVTERLLIAILIAVIILEQNFAKNSFYKMKNFKSISKLGSITYGLYCLHFIGILITITLSKKIGFNDSVFSVVFIETIVALVLSILIAKISYKFLETPFLKLKEKFNKI